MLLLKKQVNCIHAKVDSNRLLLDAGSGSDPWPEADVLCDLNVGSTLHRAGNVPGMHGEYTQHQTAKLDERPFVCCDLHYLPFKDQIFYFLHCKHVLEHLKYPNLALKEFKRVARHGYATFPSYFWEMFMNYAPSHRWIIQPSGSHKSLKPLRAWKKVISLFWSINWRIHFRDRLLFWIIRFRESAIRW